MHLNSDSVKLVDVSMWLLNSSLGLYHRLVIHMCMRGVWSFIHMHRMPVQYVLGSWQFREHLYKVRPPVLIPRPETENLVDLVLQEGPCQGTFLDIGCGSGCVSVELLLARPQLQGTAIDISRAACDLTLTNAHK